MSIHSPYVVGNTIELTYADGSVAEASIVDVKTMTMACVVLVQLPTVPAPCILKVYDRRFANHLREEFKIEPWTPEIEQDYRAFLDTGSQDALFDRWTAGYANDEFYFDRDMDWNTSTDELWMQFKSIQSYRQEVHAYNLMHDIQGTQVPKLLGEVVVRLGTSDTANLHYDCPAVLLQYIDGFPLTDLETEIDHTYWQVACDKAVEIIQQTANRGILNKDVNTRSMLVCKQDDDDPQVFMIDFGCCIFRDRYDNEADFRQGQAFEDEEGSIGIVMSKKLRGGFKYYRSERALRLAFDFMRADDASPEPWDVWLARHREAEPDCYF